MKNRFFQGNKIVVLEKNKEFFLVPVLPSVFIILKDRHLKISSIWKLA